MSFWIFPNFEEKILKICPILFFQYCRNFKIQNWEKIYTNKNLGADAFKKEINAAIIWIIQNVSPFAELNITDVIQGAKDKKAAYGDLKAQIGRRDEEIAYIGDDVVDLPILRQVGVAIAVRDAVEEVKAIADYVTSRSGGAGAVREVAELILKTQHHWELLMERYQA